ncbi:MAG: ABC transporter ATP-binding protein [Actinomycetaceae bacterium]|nr:ABC transporter ATP-binding protein [Actinomycetaceae bacterium]
MKRVQRLTRAQRRAAKIEAKKAALAAEIFDEAPVTKRRVFYRRNHTTNTRNSHDEHPPAAEGSLIHLTNIHRAFELPDGEILYILRGINLTVMPGEHISIVGRSGTGKSTLLGIMGLIDSPNMGTYHLNETNVTHLDSAALSQLRGSSIGFVFQQFNLIPARNVLENVTVPLLYAPGQEFWKRYQIASHMLQRVGLEERLESYPSQLSGGEQQRVAIARALVRYPKIILADEPTGALDVETGESVMELLEESARQVNAALVVITHDERLAQRADRVLELHDGLLREKNLTGKGHHPQHTLAQPTETETSPLGEGA